MSEILDFEKSSHKAPQHKTHWRKMAGKEFIVGEMLDGKDVTMTIKTVTIEELQSQKGTEKKVVATFEEADMKIVLNVTNMKSIAEKIGSGFVQDWIGKKVTFYPTKITAFGKTTEAIRVR